MSLKHKKANITFTFAMLLVGVFATAGFSPHFLNYIALPHVAAAPSGSFLGIDCAYGASAPAQVFPTPVTTKDGDGLLHSKCQWAGDVDGDGALDPLVSDNPSLGTAGSGGGFIADIILNNTTTRIIGFDITIDYDTRVLNAVLVDQSGLLFGGNSGCPSSNPACTLPTALTIDRTIGEVRVAQALLGTQGGPGGNCDNGVNPKCNSATQEFFRIRFDIVGSGTGFVSFSTDPIKNAIISPDLTPPSVPHTILNGALSTNDLYNVINSKPMGLGMNVSWTFSPTPEIPGSPLTFTAAAACSNCTGAFTYHWDLSSLDSPTYVPKIDGTGSVLTLTLPPPVTYRVTLNVSDGATPAHNWALAVRVLPLTSGASGLPSVTQMTQGIAGGSWNAMWLGGIVTSSSGYSGLWTFCPGSPTVTTVCNKPKTVVTQSPAPGPITQTSSVSGLVFNFAGVYNDSFQVSDTAVSQVGPNPTTVTKYFLVNVTGSTPVYAVALSPSQQVQTQGQPSSFSLTPSYGSTYPSGFKASSFSYLVTYGDGASQVVSGGLSPTLITHTYTTAGTFQVRVVAHEVGSAAPSKIMESATSTVNVVQTPLAGDFTYTPTSPTSGQTITFTATASGGSSPYTYSWGFGDGSANGTGVSPTHSYSGTGTFNVTLTMTDSFGTSFVVSHTISVGSQGSSLLIIGGGVAAALVVAAGLLLFLRRRRGSARSSKG